MTSTIPSRLTRRVAARLCRLRGTKVADSVASLADGFLRRLNNCSFDIDTNGERRVMERLTVVQPRVIFDIGANSGEWARLAAQLFPLAMIHAFEIVPSTFQELERGTRGHPRILCRPFGLSDREGTVTIHIGRDSQTATGFKIDGMKTHDQHYSRLLECPVRQASDYIREQSVSSVDFVKIDVEGMEMLVLRGFGEALRTVRAVQFEYGVFNIGSHVLLSDYCSFFARYGFRVGKVFPRTVQFFDYDFSRENFHGSNYMAVREDEERLMAGLARYGA